jgi:hypothetical protein
MFVCVCVCNVYVICVCVCAKLCLFLYSPTKIMYIFSFFTYKLDHPTLRELITVIIFSRK